MKDETRATLLGLLAWLCFALAVGVAGWFDQASALGVGATVWILTGFALLATWKIPVIHEWFASVDLRWLVGLHLTRFIGLYLLFLGKERDLPEGFAQPAGFGDIAIATITGLILLIPKLHRRKILLVWDGLGFLDILFVVFSALRFGLLDWKSMAPLRELPLSLLPTFLVPLLIASHILIFVRLRKRK